MLFHITMHFRAYRLINEKYVHSLHFSRNQKFFDQTMATKCLSQTNKQGRIYGLPATD